MNLMTKLSSFLTCLLTAALLLTNLIKRPADNLIQSDWKDRYVVMWQDWKYWNEEDWKIKQNFSEIRLAAFPDVTFRWYQHTNVHNWKTVTISAVDAEENTVDLLEGGYVSAYFSDLNDDGFPELCVTGWEGSGICTSYITAYDYHNGEKYMLNDRALYDYELLEQNGQLKVEKRLYGYHHLGRPPQSEQEIWTGYIKIENNTLIFTEESFII